MIALSVIFLSYVSCKLHEEKKGTLVLITNSGDYGNISIRIVINVH